MWIDLVIGGLSGVISRTLTAPLELYKIQRQNAFIPNSTIRDVLKKKDCDIYGKEMLLIVLGYFLKRQ